MAKSTEIEQTESKLSASAKQKMQSSGVSVKMELKAIEVIELIQSEALTDTAACKQLEMNYYTFWYVRQRIKEIAILYQLSSDARAQYHVDKSVNDIQILADDIRNETISKSQAHALVALARTQHQASLRYAALTDRKRWADKIELTTDDANTSLIDLITEAKAKRLAQASIAP